MGSLAPWLPGAPALWLPGSWLPGSLVPWLPSSQAPALPFLFPSLDHCNKSGRRGGALPFQRGAKRDPEESQSPRGVREAQKSLKSP